MNKRYKPKFDKYYGFIIIPTSVLLLGVTVGISIPYPPALFFMIPTCLLCAYFFATPFFGYVELSESAVFVRFGFFATLEIPYSGIRCVEKVRKFYADSIMSLKMSVDHVNIKHGRFDITSVSVNDNDDLVAEIERRTARDP